MTSGSDFFLRSDLRWNINWTLWIEKQKYDRSNACVKCKENKGNIVIRHVVYCRLSVTFLLKLPTTLDSPRSRLV